MTRQCPIANELLEPLRRSRLPRPRERLSLRVREQVSLADLLELPVELQQRSVLVEPRETVHLLWPLQAPCLHLDACHQQVLAPHRRREKEEVLHLPWELEPHAPHSRAELLLDRCELQECEPWCVFVWCQQRSEPHQVVERLVELWPLPPPDPEEDLWLLELQEQLQVCRCELCRPLLPWRRPLPLLQELSVVLADQPSREA